MVPLPPPEDGPTAMPRLLARVKLAVTSSVPPFKTMLPDFGTPGSSPRLVSFETDSVPPLIVVTPMYVLAPESVTTPFVVMFSPTLPPRIAPIDPDWTWKVDVDFSTPVEPMTLPLSSVNPATVGLDVLIFSVPPSTVTVPVPRGRC